MILTCPDNQMKQNVHFSKKIKLLSFWVFLWKTMSSVVKIEIYVAIEKVDWEKLAENFNQISIWKMLSDIKQKIFRLVWWKCQQQHLQWKIGIEKILIQGITLVRPNDPNYVPLSITRSTAAPSKSADIIKKNMNSRVQGSSLLAQ